MRAAQYIDTKTMVFARPMLECGRGTIIFTASFLSFQGGITVTGYTPLRAAIAGLTRALSNERSGSGVNVNVIAPGYVATDNTQSFQVAPERARAILKRIPAGRWGTPSDRDGAIIFLATSASDYVIGNTLPVDGGW